MVRGFVPWLRWLLVGWVVLASAARSEQGSPAPVAAGSGSHAWWIRKDGSRWLLEHAARDLRVDVPTLHVAARFDDEPTRLAAVEDEVWVFFQRTDRCEVVRGRADWNPASDLHFMVPAGMQLRASVPGPTVIAAAATPDAPWVLAGPNGPLLRLRGDRWLPVAMPEVVADAGHRSLCTVQGELWLVWQSQQAAARRWRWSPDGWVEAPLSMPADAVPLGGPSRMMVAVGQPAQVGRVELGEFRPLVEVPTGASVVPWGEGLAAVRMHGSRTLWSEWQPGRGGFSSFEALVEQRSKAIRWFHIPVLGVLSLGALMLAFLVRSVGGAPMELHAPPMAAAHRLLALMIDAAPVAAVALLAFDADMPALLTPPIWSTDLTEAMPCIAMCVGTVIFGAFEEIVGAGSIGKRLFGGMVCGQSPGPVGWWRHLLRNLLKGLVMLSPLLALPTLLSPRGIGVPEAVSRTLVTLRRA